MSAFGGKADIGTCHEKRLEKVAGSAMTVNVRFWQKADMTTAFGDVCFWRNSGHSALRKERRYSITLSALTMTESGTVRPSAFAVLRLMTSSNLVGSSTGSSAGLAPLMILST